MKGEHPSAEDGIVERTVVFVTRYVTNIIYLVTASLESESESINLHPA